MNSWISNNIGGPAVLIFVGVLISAAGALWASKQQAASERRIGQKNEEIAKLSKQIAHSVTGGDSFCYLAFSLPDKGGTKAILAVVHKGNFPLYDVSVRIVDLDKFDIHVKGKQKPTLDNIQKTEQVINIGNLSPSHAATLHPWMLPKSGEARYNIFISARNGFVTELVRLKRINGKWASAYRVEAGPGREPGILYEKIDTDFPRNDDGKVNW